MITKGHVNFMVAGTCAVLIVLMVLMIVFNDLVFYEDDISNEETIAETCFEQNTESASDLKETREELYTPETKSLKTAENESKSVPEETTAETELLVVEETVIEIEEMSEQYLPIDRYLGEFLLTAYCPCSYCCGKSDGITATGTVATQGKTIAVDPRVIPYGSKVEINGYTYIAEDCGGAIKSNKIDIFFNTHQEALNFGIKYASVYLVGSNE